MGCPAPAGGCQATRTAVGPVTVAARLRTAVGATLTAGTRLTSPWVCTWAALTQPASASLNWIRHQVGTVASLPTISYLVVDPPAREPTRRWLAPGPERTLRPNVTLDFRLACGGHMTGAALAWPVVRTAAAGTQPRLSSRRRSSHQVGLAENWPQISGQSVTSRFSVATTPCVSSGPSCTSTVSVASSVDHTSCGRHVTGTYFR